jgi:hypothetical protein
MILNVTHPPHTTDVSSAPPARHGDGLSLYQYSARYRYTASHVAACLGVLPTSPARWRRADGMSLAPCSDPVLVQVSDRTLPGSLSVHVLLCAFAL